MFKKLLIIPVTLAFTACGGSSSDPKTEARSDLNPPSGLTTVSAPTTGKLELRWNAVNTEKDFMGYHVFGVKGDIASISAGAKYPAAVNLVSQAIPRCEDNNDLFTAFGFKEKSTKGCKGDTTTDSKFVGSSDLKVAEAEEVLASASPCAANSAAGISYSAKPSKKATHVCAVSKYWDGTALADMVAGETYTFFVVSVLGEKLNKISWTSNFISDTPPTTVFSGDLVVKKDKIQYFEFDLAAIDTAITAATEAACTLCRVYDKTPIGTVASGKARIQFNRGTGYGTPAAYAERIAFSTPATGAVTYAYRGRQTLDPIAADGTVSSSIPGDSAAAPEDTTTLTPYVADGTKTIAYGNQVFDLRFVSGTTVNYGKVVVKDPSYSPNTADGDATINVTILIQKKVGSFDYFRSN